MKIAIDKTIYNNSCLAKSVYALADRYIIERHSKSEIEEEWIFEAKDEDKAKEEVFRTLNDYLLRCLIEEETHDIRTILYAKSFSDCDDISESDLD